MCEGRTGSDQGDTPPAAGSTLVEAYAVVLGPPDR